MATKEGLAFAHIRGVSKRGCLSVAVIQFAAIGSFCSILEDMTGYDGIKNGKLWHGCGIAELILTECHSQ